MHTLNWGKQKINSLFSDLIKGIITEDEFNDLSDELYKKQTRLRYTYNWARKGVISERKLLIKKESSFTGIGVEWGFFFGWAVSLLIDHQLWILPKYFVDVNWKFYWRYYIFLN